MNKQSPEYIRIREEIAKFLCTDVIAEFKWEWLGDSDKTYYKNFAESILAIKGIGIIADDQSLPKTEFILLGTEPHAYNFAQGDMLKANFKRLVE